MSDLYALDKYLIRRKVFKLLGAGFHIYDPEMQRVYFYAEQKAFKLKEDFTVFGDEAKTQPVLRIQARNIIDFSGTYDITDIENDEVVGCVRRKGLKSILRDEWEILDPDENVIAIAQEDSAALAIVRRFLSNLIPQGFDVKTPGGELVARFGQYFNPFVFKMELDFSHDKNDVIDRRLGIGLATCMMALEGRQQ